MTAMPTTLADELAQHVRDYGGTEEEAAAIVIPRRARATEVRESTDPEVLHPAIRETMNLSAKIDKIVKTISTPELWRFETDAGPVHLGAANRWGIRPAEFKIAFLCIGETPTVPPAGPLRDELWRMIARAAVPENIGEGATDAGWAREVLRSYLDDRPPFDDPSEAATCEYPCVIDGRTVVFGRALNRYVLLNLQERLSPRELGSRLSAAGCQSYAQNVTVHGGRTQRGAWRLPADWPR